MSFVIASVANLKEWDQAMVLKMHTFWRTVRKLHFLFLSLHAFVSVKVFSISTPLSTQITSQRLLFTLHVSGALYLFTHNLRLITFLYNEASRGFVLATRISLSDNINSLSNLCQAPTPVNPKWWKMTGFLHHRLPHSLLHFPHSTTRLTHTLS